MSKKTRASNNGLYASDGSKISPKSGKRRSRLSTSCPDDDILTCVLEHLEQQPVVECMTRLHHAEVPDDRVAKQGKVSHRVQHFVPDELVRKTQTVGIEDREFVHHDGVVERAAFGQAHLLQHLDIAQEAEGARPGYFSRKHPVRK